MTTEDPCAILAELEAAYRSTLQAGGQVKRVRYRSPTGSEEEVEFGTANVSFLVSEIRRYRGLCSAKRGVTDRFCITAG